jgi:hypothetical protein
VRQGGHDRGILPIDEVAVEGFGGELMAEGSDGGSQQTGMGARRRQQE